VAAAPALSVGAVAGLVAGRLIGDGEKRLTGVRPLETASEADLSFLVSPRYLPYFRASRAGAVLLGEAHAGEPGGPATRIVVPDVARALEQSVLAFVPPPAHRPGIDPAARIGAGAVVAADAAVGPWTLVGEGATIGARSRIGSGVVIGEGVAVGSDCVIDDHVVCYPGAVLGDRVVLKAAAVIAGPGFGYASDRQGHRRIRHIGRCVLEDDVEVGSGSCVDRGTLEDTVIGRGTKIDNLVMVGHNVRIGERCLVMAKTGIAGSVRIGSDVIIAGGVGIRDHAEIGDGARLAAMSGIFGNIDAGATVGGYPARNHREFLRAQAALYALAPIARDLATLLAERTQRAPSND
jgi:UDP-3-O-[3-hydroxymyristoyl] glucosamine N-acyltransferase